MSVGGRRVLTTCRPLSTRKREGRRAEKIRTKNINKKKPRFIIAIGVSDI